MEIIDLDILKKMAVSIGEVASITGVPVRQLRYWASKNIIQSVDDGLNKTRKFDYCEIKKIILIKELLEEGYTLQKATEKVLLRSQNLQEAFKKFAAASNEE